MGIVLLLAALTVIIITFICALTEAAIYSVPYAFVKHLADSGSRSGKILLSFKEEMSNPITAILVANTVCAVLGSALLGALAGEVLAPTLLAVFGITYTLVTLYLAEITPKILGVAFAKPIAVFSAVPLSLMIIATSPLIWVSRSINRAFSKGDESNISEEEMLSLAAIGTEEGVLDTFEGSVIANVIALDKLYVRDVLTPRVVVFRLSEDTVIESLHGQLQSWAYTRVPLYRDDNSDDLHGYVIQRDIYRELVSNSGLVRLKELARPLTIVPELMRADKLLLKMFVEKEHICAVVDEHGSFAGIITLEDIIEEILGQEIVDEYDKVSDMRSLARSMRIEKTRAHRERVKETLSQKLARELQK